MITIYKDDMLKLHGKHGIPVVFKGLQSYDDIGGMMLYLMISLDSKINHSSLLEVTEDHMEIFKLIRVVNSNHVDMPIVIPSQICKVLQGMRLNEDLKTCNKNDEIVVPRIMSMAFPKRNFSIPHFLWALFVIWRNSAFCNKERKPKKRVVMRNSSQQPKNLQSVKMGGPRKRTKPPNSKALKQNGDLWRLFENVGMVPFF